MRVSLTINRLALDQVVVVLTSQKPIAVALRKVSVLALAEVSSLGVQLSSLWLGLFSKSGETYSDNTFNVAIVDIEEETLHYVDSNRLASRCPNRKYYF